VTSALGSSAGDVLKDGASLLDKVKSLFGKK